MLSEKRGQSAAGAAVLITIIAGLLVMFIVLVNPQERAELLGESSSSTSGDLPNSVIQKNLLTESPGRIDYLPQKFMEKPLPVVNIYTKTEAKILAEKSFANAKKAIFSEEVNSLSFPIPDLSNTNNILLDFNIKRLKGKLRITLNEELIYEDSPNLGTMQPLVLPKNLLNNENFLVFSVSSPGLAFWQTNEASLERIKLVADVTSLEFQSSKNIFLVSETEKNNLEKVELKFLPECEDGKVSKLQITVNEDEVFNGIPDCGIPMVPIPILADNLNVGQNKITFSADKGAYILSHNRLKYELKDVDFPLYYFDISHEQYLEIMDGNKRVRLRMDFVDIVANKRGDLEFNGNLNYFDTKETFYTIDLSEDVVKGANAIKIKPRKTLDVREVKIDLIN